MQSGNSSGSISPPSPDQKPATSETSEMLTPSELARLRQAGKDADVYLRKAYPGVKIRQ